MNSSEPQIGDFVRFPTHRADQTGLVIDNTCETGWCDILLENGEIMKWPSVQLRVIMPAELTDEQLEEVVGGMSSERFSTWRAEKLNESR